MPGSNYELKVGDTSLYLYETDEGEVFLYFFSPEKSINRREECRIDLTDFGSDAVRRTLSSAISGKVGQRRWENYVVKRLDKVK